MAKAASLKAFRERRVKNKKEIDGKVSQGGAVLAKMASEGAMGTRILMHNGIITCVYGFAGFLVCYVALQAAFYFVAFLAGSTGAYLMEDQADVLTAYVILIMVCGLCLFFACGIERALIKAASRRFWHKDKINSCIDRGAAWRERHPEDKNNN